MAWSEKWNPSTVAAPRRVPMEWCAFVDRPVIVNRQSWDGGADRHGVPVTFAILVDGREVPFKLVRGMRGADAQPRDVMVALHGMGVTAATFHGILPALLQTHDVLIVDYNSFGGRGWPRGGVSLRMLAAALWPIVDCIGAERVSMIGSSLGGSLALIAATTHPERVENLILINPAAYPQPLPKMYRLARIPLIGDIMMRFSPAEKFIGGVAYIGYSAPEKMPEDIRRAYERNMEKLDSRLKLMDVMRALPANERDMQDQLRRQRQLSQRTLLLWGKLEKLLPADTGQRLSRDLPNSTLLEFDDLAHLPHEEDPRRLGAEIERFLGAGVLAEKIARVPVGV